MKITYKEIAQMIGRSEQNIKYMKKNNPQILKVIRVGCLVEKYNIDINKTTV